MSNKATQLGTGVKCKCLDFKTKVNQIPIVWTETR